jgi:hypothetical protein
MQERRRRLEGPGHERRREALRRRFQLLSRKAARTPRFGLRRKRQSSLDIWIGVSLLGIFFVAVAVIEQRPALWRFSADELAARHLASEPNCDAARAQGLAPARRGEPGYWPQHDRDRDGVSCEPYRRG